MYIYKFTESKYVYKIKNCNSCVDKLGELQDGNKFTVQSGSELQGASIFKVMDTGSKNVKFSDQLESFEYRVDSVIDETRKITDMNDATLQQFFNRPVKITSFNWGTGTTFYQNFNPWKLFFENPRVVNRIANFSLMRAKLHIKIVINGNGFQYGRLIASYLPYPTYDFLSTNASLVQEDVVQASQLPHIYLDPCTSTGGEMVLPFFHSTNNLRIYANEWERLGELTIRSMQGLKHANGATDVVTVSVFAWAEDVELSVLTSREPSTLVPQSGDETDEANSKGVISGPATAVADIAGSLARLPMIAPYALATQTAATNVASVAKLFGYCSPVVTKDPEPLKPTLVSDMAVTNTPEFVRKLTLDNKQELSIDPRVTGLGDTDELNLKSIAQRESWLTSFNWAIGTAAETLLWNTRVNPVSWNEDGLVPNGIHLPACAVAALPFDYWTGTMKYRFQIVCSSFHKGRLKIVFDPNFMASNEYNTNYLEIIDIADKTDFTISVAPSQQISIMSHKTPGVDSVTEVFSTTPYAFNDVGNGVLAVYVVNELTTPNSTVNNDIEVNVFISAGDDFEVFVPNDAISKYVYKPQSGKEVVPESQNTQEPSAPQHEIDEYVLGSKIREDNLTKVFVGESVKSFRTLLKRYNLHSAVGDDILGTRVISAQRNMFPFLRGNVTGAVGLTNLAAPYNYCNTVMLHWVRNCFSGWRGSIRWKVLPMFGYSDTKYVVRRLKSTGNSYVDTNTAAGVFNNMSEAGYLVSDPTYSFNGMQGMAYQHTSINPALEFEIPYYSAARFSPGKPTDYTTNTDALNGVQTASLEKYQVLMHTSNTTANDWIGFYCAAGEDFQCYFWTGCPRLYYEATMPTPEVA